MTRELDVPRKDPNFVSRRFDDELILVPIRRKLSDLNAMYLLKGESSIRAWELMDGKRTFSEIASAVCAEFEVEPKRVEADLRKFLSELESAGGIKARAKART